MSCRGPGRSYRASSTLRSGPYGCFSHQVVPLQGRSRSSGPAVTSPGCRAGQRQDVLRAGIAARTSWCCSKFAHQRRRSASTRDRPGLEILGRGRHTTEELSMAAPCSSLHRAAQHRRPAVGLCCLMATLPRLPQSLLVPPPLSPSCRPHPHASRPRRRAWAGSTAASGSDGGEGTGSGAQERGAGAGTARTPRLVELYSKLQHPALFNTRYSQAMTVSVPHGRSRSPGSLVGSSACRRAPQQRSPWAPCGTPCER